MGALIESFATVRGHHEPFAQGALKLADAAIATCLERAGRAAADLDLLVNAGVYRNDNLGEPALAALIQEDVGANTRRWREAHGTFSFERLQRRRRRGHSALSAGWIPRRQHRPGSGGGQRRASRWHGRPRVSVRARGRRDAARARRGGCRLRRLRVRHLSRVRVAAERKDRLGRTAAERRAQCAVHRRTAWLRRSRRRVRCGFHAALPRSHEHARAGRST